MAKPLESKGENLEEWVKLREAKAENLEAKGGPNFKFTL